MCTIDVADDGGKRDLIPQSSKLSNLRRLHANLGHPEKQRLDPSSTTLIRPKQAPEAAKHVESPACDAAKFPKVARHSVLSEIQLPQNTLRRTYRNFRDGSLVNAWKPCTSHVKEALCTQSYRLLTTPLRHRNLCSNLEPSGERRVTGKGTFVDGHPPEPAAHRKRARQEKRTGSTISETCVRRLNSFCLTRDAESRITRRNSATRVPRHR